MKKRFLIVVVVIVGFLAAAVAAKNALVKTAVETGGSLVLGAEVKIDRLSLSLIKSRVYIRGLKVYNPQGFPREAMVDINELGAQIDVPALMRNKIHIPQMVLKINEIVVVKDKEGKLNIDALKVMEKNEAGTDKNKKPQAGKNMPFSIDAATLTLGKVVMKDFTGAQTPRVNVYESPVKDKTYRHIDSAQKLVLLILGESLKGTAIKSALLYGAAAVTGVGIIPLAAGSVLAGKDSVTQIFKLSAGRLFDAARESLSKLGKVTVEDRDNGILKAAVGGSAVAVKITAQFDKESKIVISARKLMLPQPGVAGGVLHEIEQKVNR